jgi:tRNA threonylcarbamoyladenosine biosynthesis protein TsaB
MNVLAIDTATEVLAIAAVRGAAWASLCVRRGLQHAPSLLPLVDRLFEELGMTAADLELLVCSLGPGSFTGIRIGLATALGIAEGRGIPVEGVSTLDALAKPWESHAGDVFPVIDARKGKIYAARFQGGVRVSEYLDVSPIELSALCAAADSPLLSGPDSGRIRDLLGESGRGLPYAEVLDPCSLLRIGVEKHTKEGADPLALRPLYLRKSEAEIASGL